MIQYMSVCTKACEEYFSCNSFVYHSALTCNIINYITIYLFLHTIPSVGPYTDWSIFAHTCLHKCLPNIWNDFFQRIRICVSQLKGVFVILHSLSFCNVTEEGHAALNSALRSNPTHLKDLSLSGNNLKH